MYTLVLHAQQRWTEPNMCAITTYVYANGRGRFIRTRAAREISHPTIMRLTLPPIQSTRSVKGRNRKNRLDPVQTLVYRELLRNREWTPGAGRKYGSRAQTIRILDSL